MGLTVRRFSAPLKARISSELNEVETHKLTLTEPAYLTLNLTLLMITKPL